MYCPNCATQNDTGTKFCRACGTNLSLVPKAITGQLKLSRRQQRELERGRERGLGPGITQSFMGFGFLLVALALGLNNIGWWVWMLIPAFAMMGKGVADIVVELRSKKEQEIAIQRAINTGQHARVTGETAAPDLQQPDFLPPPASVTEGTTRMMDPPPGVDRERH
jgi:hypothetical protein